MKKAVDEATQKCMGLRKGLRAKKWRGRTEVAHQKAGKVTEYS